jgi:hypothetical protein
MNQLRLSGQVVFRNDQVLFTLPESSSFNNWELRQVCSKWALVMDVFRKYFIDLETFQVHEAFYDPDGFVWCEELEVKEKNGKWYALVDGCVWACPYVLDVFEIPSGTPVCDSELIKELGWEDLQHEDSSQYKGPRNIFQMSKESENDEEEKKPPLRIGVDYGGVCSVNSAAHEDTKVDDVPPLNMDGCLEALQKLKSQGHQLILVSFCGRKRANQVREYLPRQFPGLFDEMFFVKDKKFKDEVCRVEKLDVLIDDSPDVFGSNEHAILFQNWNKVLEEMKNLSPFPRKEVSQEDKEKLLKKLY